MAGGAVFAALLVVIIGIAGVRHMVQRGGEPEGSQAADGQLQDVDGNHNGTLEETGAALDAGINAGDPWKVSIEESAAEDDAAAQMGAIVPEVQLPARYDLREHTDLGKVRDQGMLSTCWAFASLNALTGSMPESMRVPLSVDHMAQKNSFGLSVADGGDYTISSAYLLAWQGPVAEAEDAYGDGYSPDGLEPVCHVQEIQILPENNMDAIKHAVYENGGVQSSFYIPQDAAGSRAEFYREDTYAYYYNGELEANHDTVIVGWDDMFPKENFVSQPEQDGAFICMNTWGESFGDHGFFYISYEDSQLGLHNVAYTGVEAADNYDSIYQSDLCGWTAQLGYGTSKAWFANVYEAAADENVAAAGFYATVPETEYKVYAVKVDTDAGEQQMDAVLTAGTLVAEGRVENAGYYTVSWNAEFPVGAGERFAVIVEIDSPGTSEPVAIEYRTGSRTENIDIEDGEGYISSDGAAWQRSETSEGCNVCLKAYGRRR